MKKQTVLFIGGPCNGDTATIPWPWYGTGRVIRSARGEHDFLHNDKQESGEEMSLAKEYITREFHHAGEIYLIAFQLEISPEHILQQIQMSDHQPLP